MGEEEAKTSKSERDTQFKRIQASEEDQLKRIQADGENRWELGGSKRSKLRWGTVRLEESKTSKPIGEIVAFENEPS